jgi:hypothetical protein
VPSHLSWRLELPRKWSGRLLAEFRSRAAAEVMPEHGERLVADPIAPLGPQPAIQFVALR